MAAPHCVFEISFPAPPTKTAGIQSFQESVLFFPHKIVALSFHHSTTIRFHQIIVILWDQILIHAHQIIWDFTSETNSLLSSPALDSATTEFDVTTRVFSPSAYIAPTIQVSLWFQLWTKFNLSTTSTLSSYHVKCVHQINVGVAGAALACNTVTTDNANNHTTHNSVSTTFVNAFFFWGWVIGKIQNG